MTDQELIERLRRMSPRLDMLDCEYVLTSADRIEGLMKDRKFILDERDRTFVLMLARAEEAESKLAMAVEALETIVDNGGAGSYHLARTTLAELDGK